MRAEDSCVRLRVNWCGMHFFTAMVVTSVHQTMVDILYSYERVLYMA